jgi:hypothetical protein
VVALRESLMEALGSRGNASLRNLGKDKKNTYNIISIGFSHPKRPGGVGILLQFGAIHFACSVYDV